VRMAFKIDVETVADCEAIQASPWAIVLQTSLAVLTLAFFSGESLPHLRRASSSRTKGSAAVSSSGAEDAVARHFGGAQVAEGQARVRVGHSTGFVIFGDGFEVARGDRAAARMKSPRVVLESTAGSSASDASPSSFARTCQRSASAGSSGFSSSAV